MAEATALAALASREGMQSSLRKLDELPAALQRVNTVVAESRHMLELRENWDGEGATAISEATWQRAIDFVLRTSTELCDRFQVSPPVPDLAPVPDGSVDIDWRFDGHELVVNVPTDSSASAEYYGDDGNGGRSIKGRLDLNAQNHWLFVWLTE